MEILVRHTITLDPEVIALLKGFSGGHQAPVKEMTASPAKGSKAAQKAEAAKEETKETPAPEVTTETAPVITATQEISFTDIRQLYLQKKEEGKQEKVKEILE